MTGSHVMEGTVLSACSISSDVKPSPGLGEDEGAVEEDDGRKNDCMEGLFGAILK